MYKNKKSTFYGNMVIFTFFCLLVSIIFFVGYTLFAIGNDYYAIPIQELSLDMNYSTAVNQGFTDVTNNYHDTPLIFFDYVFLISFITTVVGLLLASYRARALNYFSWLFGLIYFQMILLFLLGVSLLYTNWIFDLIIAIMPNLDMQLPIMSYVLENLGVIFLLISCSCFLLNVVDFDFTTLIGRKQKENNTLDQNEIF